MITSRHLWTLLPAILTVVGISIISGCEGCGCGGEDHVAELISANGQVERDFADRHDQWEDVSEGVRFGPGDGLRTGSGGSARVKLARGGSLRLGENSFVRFLTSAPETTAPRMQIDLGAAEIRGGEHGVELQTPVSLVRVDDTSVLNVEFGQEGQAHFEVLVGQASYLTEEEEPRPLRPGRRYTVDLGSGRIAEALRRAGAQVGEAALPETQPDAGAEFEGDFTVQVAGRPVKVRAPDSKVWAPLEVGAGEIASGSTVKLGDRTTVELQGKAARASLYGAAEASFGVSGALMRLSRGRAVASSLGEAVALAFPGGTLALSPHARLSMSIGRPGGAVVRVIRGEVQVRSGEEEHTLGPGAVAVIARDGNMVVERPPSRAAFNISAGTSASVHDPRSPTSVGIRFGEACANVGLVEVPGEEGQSVVAQGSGRAILRLSAGAHDYRLYCVVDGVTSETPAASGRLRILRDPGTTPFGVPSHNTVNADGRRYTVIYQNILPRITFRWSKAPEASSYSLNVTSSTGLGFSKTTTRPQFTLASGLINEGSYTFQFSAGGQRSPQSRLTLRHDAVMVVASFREPTDGSISAGQRVSVVGNASPGSTVQVGSKTLAFESQTRFSGEAVAPTEEDALAIRVNHPAAGLHYFLRHLATSAR